MYILPSFYFHAFRFLIMAKYMFDFYKSSWFHEKDTYFAARVQSSVFG